MKISKLLCHVFVLLLGVVISVIATALIMKSFYYRTLSNEEIRLLWSCVALWLVMIIIICVVIANEQKGWLSGWTALLVLLFIASVVFFMTVDPGRMIYFVYWISVAINITIIFAALFLIFSLIVLCIKFCVVEDDVDSDVRSTENYQPYEDEEM